MSFNIECQEKEAFPVLSMRTRTPVSNLPSVLGEAYDLVAKYITEQGGEFAFAPFVAYYNMDMNDLDVEIGISGECRPCQERAPFNPCDSCRQTGDLLL
jgi:hypothetical protein